MKRDFLTSVYDDMEKGVYNYCDSKGNCIQCGECCTAFLPVSKGELEDIERYVKKKHISPHPVHKCLAENNPDPVMDLTCPFLDANKKDHKCMIYPVRPHICRSFKCNIKPSQIRENKMQFSKTHTTVNMWNYVNGNQFSL